MDAKTTAQHPRAFESSRDVAQHFKKYPEKLVKYVESGFLLNNGIVGEHLKEFLAIAGVGKEAWENIPDNMFVSPRQINGIQGLIETMRKKYRLPSPPPRSYSIRN